MTRVLVTDGTGGQTRSAIAAVRALAKAGYEPWSAEPGRDAPVTASRFLGGYVEVPTVTSDPEGFRAAIEQEVERSGHRTVLAASDAALLALGAPVRGLVDKAALRNRATSAGVQMPPEERFASWEQLRERAEDLPFPAVVKPNVSTLPARRVDTPQQVRDLTPGSGPVIVQAFVEGPMTALAGVKAGGRLVASIHQRYLRTWPIDCGTSSAAVSVRADRELEERAVVLLGDYEGIFQIQLRAGLLLDVNPRVYGSLPLAVAAGANLAAIHVEVVTGGTPPPTSARTGVRYRWLEGDLRAVAGMVRSGDLRIGAAAAAVRPRWGTAHSTFSWGDPGPALRRLRALRDRGGART